MPCCGPLWWPARALSYSAVPAVQTLQHHVCSYACWDPEARVRVRVVCARPYHALFAHNMLIRWVGLMGWCSKGRGLQL